MTFEGAWLGPRCSLGMAWVIVHRGQYFNGFRSRLVGLPAFEPRWSEPTDGSLQCVLFTSSDAVNRQLSDLANMFGVEAEAELL